MIVQLTSTVVYVYSLGTLLVRLFFSHSLSASRFSCNVMLSRETHRVRVAALALLVLLILAFLHNQSDERKRTAKFLQGHQQYPQFGTVLLLCAIVNESNAGPERLFSRVTKETRGRRSQLACHTCDAIVRIQELGADVKDVDVELRTQESRCCWSQAENSMIRKEFVNFMSEIKRAMAN